jgi:MerR family transcriptional regulator, heat shock protein HspR
MPAERDPDLGVYSISVAAELSGVSAQTLRLYETRGLLDPDRTAGGTRRYSPRDLEQIDEITALSAEGLNLAGITRVLHLQAETRRLNAELAELRRRTATA